MFFNTAVKEPLQYHTSFPKYIQCLQLVHQHFMGKVPRKLVFHLFQFAQLLFPSQTANGHTGHTGNCRVPSHGSFLQRLLSPRFCDSYRASRTGCPPAVRAMGDLTALCWIPYCFTREHGSTNRVNKHILSPGRERGSRLDGFFCFVPAFFPQLWRSSENMKAASSFQPSQRNKIRACPSILFEKHLSSINSFIRIRGEAESKWSLLADKKPGIPFLNLPTPWAESFMHIWRVFHPDSDTAFLPTCFFAFKWLKRTELLPESQFIF